MALTAEQLEPFEINDEDDVWNALYILGVKDSIKKILKYYRYETEGGKEEQEEQEEQEGGEKRFRQVRVKDIEDFFNTLDSDQQEEVLMYFLGKNDKDGLVLFYRSLGHSEQRAIIEKMLFEIFETRSDEKIDEEIRKSRKKLLGSRSSENMNEAINAALQNNPGKTILFLKENIFQIPKFIDTASEDVAISVLLEILKYIPDPS